MSQLDFVDRVLKETREVDHISSSAESISVVEDNEARARFKRSRSVKRTKKRVAVIKTEAASTTRAVVGENPEPVGEQGGEAVAEAAAEAGRYDSAEVEQLVLVEPLLIKRNVGVTKRNGGVTKRRPEMRWQRCKLSFKR